MRRWLLSLAASVLCTFVGCEKERSSEPAAAASATAVATPAPAAVAPTTPPANAQPAIVALEGETLPIPADFEEEAEKSITKSNYKSALESLEAEIR